MVAGCGRPTALVGAVEGRRSHFRLVGNRLRGIHQESAILHEGIHQGEPLCCLRSGCWWVGKQNKMGKVSVRSVQAVATSVRSSNFERLTVSVMVSSLWP